MLTPTPCSPQRLAETLQKNQIARYRTNYMKAIIRQDVGWFDISNPQELSTAFGETISTLEKGLGFPVWGILAMWGGTALSSLILAFVYQPAVAGLEMAFVPAVW